MPYYQHYSFDLWLTLIKSNPQFKIQRAHFFHQNFNNTGKSVDDIALIFRQVDLMCNAVNEKTGKNIDADEMYLMVISLINGNRLNIDDIDYAQLHLQMEELLFTYPPQPYSDVTIEALQHLKQKSGATFSLLSNTGYITGKTLRKVLALYGLDNYFDFQLYSDEAGMSKPNHDFFKLMLNNIDICNAGKNIPLTNIIHIGDNAKNDVKPAQEIGISSMLVNVNSATILSLVS
ncbi:HAD family hydrolase [Mucilaginibacter sp. 14171R-50]|uniref:HAD family hydrolase n=1 Tax=Mucilaginibacter sp. 14171R-50 TaxID=2703789 RepID=UPI00138B8625|nr:HAD family hydrolase [Mucilaginibacter sp. 14171R-50]QHS57554.1 HAD family hydrolase [Mucilaginibacter sp. 14171R-50]